MLKSNVVFVRSIVFAIVLVGICLPFDVFAQATLNDFEGALNSEYEVIKRIGKTILNIVILAGLIGVVWAYASKDGEAKKYITHFVIAIVVAGIGRALLLGGTN